uniref:Uncharacterized protein n=1 Tax=Siphoviridae sp. cttqT1 TaxID=2827961 RepID=A0A8S5TP51_9CAUD|nr:MAG TPA: hypothetical protein [Siphoviridae sp. cttqT1]
MTPLILATSNSWHDITSIRYLEQKKKSLPFP